MIYAIGDIHGQNTMLKVLLNELESRLKPADKVIFLGDYIDRGENSKATIDTLLEWQERWPMSRFLKGNHEQMMMDSIGKNVDLYLHDNGNVSMGGNICGWLQNGGAKTLLDYGLRGSLELWEMLIPTAHDRFFKRLGISVSTEKFCFVHAGLVPPGVDWHSEPPLGTDPHLWIREPFLSYAGAFLDNERVIFGHTPQQSGQPLVMPNKIGIDTGGCFGGCLTCAVLNDETGKAERFLQATSEQKPKLRILAGE